MTRVPDWVYFQPECPDCDDTGCPSCTETFPVTLDDLDEIAAEIAASESKNMRIT